MLFFKSACSKILRKVQTVLLNILTTTYYIIYKHDAKLDLIQQNKMIPKKK